MENGRAIRRSTCSPDGSRLAEVERTATTRQIARAAIVRRRNRLRHEPCLPNLTMRTSEKNSATVTVGNAQRLPTTKLKSAATKFVNRRTKSRVTAREDSYRGRWSSPHAGSQLKAARQMGRVSYRLRSVSCAHGAGPVREGSGLLASGPADLEATRAPRATTAGFLATASGPSPGSGDHGSRRLGRSGVARFGSGRERLDWPPPWLGAGQAHLFLR